jgi:oligosaccharide translocation protein RFT1
MPTPATQTLSLLSSLIGLQLFSRLITFFLNQSLLHLATPEAYGTASIQFELFLNTILFLSREGVRNALLRSDSLRPKPDSDSAPVDNKGKKPAGNKVSDEFERTLRVAYVPLLAGIPLACGSCLAYWWVASAEAKAQSWFSVALLVYTAAAVIELASEPLYNLAVAQSRTQLRVRAEGLAVISRTTTTFLVLLYDYKYGYHGVLALLGFAAGQLSYSFVLVSLYAASYGPGRLSPEFFALLTVDGVDVKALQLAKTMTSQSIIKHVLTEGDKLLLSWLAPLQDQGGYAVAVNYGSLVARILLQPIEETSRIYFAKANASPPSNKNTSDAATSNVRHTPSTQNMTAISDYFTNLLRILGTFSLLLLTFAPPYLPTVLTYFLPRRYITDTSAPRILGVWVYYIPILAFNGVLEAFYSAVANSSDLSRQSKYMTVFSGLYISSAVVLFTVLKVGDVSLVYANMINLTARIAFCGAFAQRWFHERSSQIGLWQRVFPKPTMVGMMLLSRLVIAADEKRLGFGERPLGVRHVLEHFAVGGAMGLCCLAVWWTVEGRTMVRTARSKLE